MTLVLATLLAVSPLPLSTRWTQSDPATGRIEGIVVRDSDSMIPVSGVRVTVAAESAFFSPPLFETRTDAGGRFAFELDAATYLLGIADEGYRLTSASDRRVVVPPGGVASITFPARPNAVVSGRLLGLDGRGRAGAIVELMGVIYEFGRRILVPATRTESGMSDDDGVFQITEVEPGEYYLRARSESGSFLPIYHPGRFVPGLGVPIRIAPGETISNADIRIPEVPAHEVRFRVDSVVPPSDTRPSRAPRMQLRTLGAVTLDAWPQSFTADSLEDGTFVLPSVPPGEYELFVGSVPGETERTLARIAFRVVDSDVDLGTITMSQGITLEGQTDGSRLSESVIEGDIFISMRSFAFGAGDGVSNPVAADGSFRTDPLVNGRYMVSVRGLPTNVYVRSISYRGREGLFEGVEVDSNLPGRIDVVLADDGGRIEGVVVEADGTPAGSEVILIPDRTRRGTAVEFQTDRSSNLTGAFEFDGVPPGDYRVLAYRPTAYPETGSRSHYYQDPEFLRAHEGTGEAVFVVSGVTNRLRLRVDD